MAEKTTYQLMLEMAANLDSSYVRALEKAKEGMKELTKEEEATLTASQKLRREIKQQESKLKDIETAYTNVTLEQGENSDEAQRLKSEYDGLNSELQQNKSKLKGVSDSLKKTDDALEDVTEEAKESKSGFTVLKGAISGFLANAGTKLLEWAGNAAKSVYNLGESTREYRKIMASLDTSSQQQGYTAEQTAESYNKLYGVLGDQQSAATTVSNLQALKLEQKDLQSLTDSVIGAWATYGDSIPIDSLSEAVNETVKVGKVTGTFADALNWAGMSEDDFNTKLENAETEAERANLVMQALADQGLDKAGAAWQENNKNLIDANKAQANYDKQLGRFGDKIEPISTAVKNGAAGLLSGVGDLFESLNTDAISNGIGDTFAMLSATVTPLLQTVGQLLPPISSIATMLLSTLSTMLPTVTPILQAAIGFISETLPVVMQFLQPILSAVQQILPMISQLATSLFPALSQTMQMLSPVLQFIGQIIGSVVVNAFNLLMPAIQNVIVLFQGLLDFIQNVFAGNWSGAWRTIVDTFGTIWSSVKGLVKAPINGVISIINRAISSINSLSVTIPDWVPGLGGKTLGFNIPSIPQLAKGGIVSSPTLAMVGEGREPEIVSPLSDFERMITNNSDYNNVTFAPTIHINGTADRADIDAAMSDAYERFKAFFERYMRDKRRVSLSGAF